LQKNEGSQGRERRGHKRRELVDRRLLLPLVGIIINAPLTPLLACLARIKSNYCSRDERTDEGLSPLCPADSDAKDTSERLDTKTSLERPQDGADEENHASSRRVSAACDADNRADYRRDHGGHIAKKESTQKGRRAWVNSRVGGEIVSHKGSIKVDWKCWEIRATVLMIAVGHGTDFAQVQRQEHRNGKRSSKHGRYGARNEMLRWTKREERKMRVKLDSINMWYTYILSTEYRTMKDVRSLCLSSSGTKIEMCSGSCDKLELFALSTVHLHKNVVCFSCLLPYS
jgi:hypothetical protein